jgi:hypothetical protein
VSNCFFVTCAQIMLRERVLVAELRREALA